MESKIIIIDLGSYSVKIGLVGQPKPYFIRSKMKIKDISENPVPLMDYKWDIMEIRWNHIFEFLRLIIEEQLKIPFSTLPNYSIVLLIPPLQPRSHFLKYYRTLLEQFKIKRMVVLTANMVALLGTKKITGITVDIGYKSTRALPYYEGFRIPHAFCRQTLAGKEIDNYKISILEQPTIPEKDYIISSSKLVLSAINKCDEEIREELFSNIVLTGWWSCNKGVAKLLEESLKREQPNMEINLKTPVNPYYNWTSTSQLAVGKLNDFVDIVDLSQKPYAENKESELFLTLSGLKTNK
jgi:actin-related protein